MVVLLGLRREAEFGVEFAFGEQAIAIKDETVKTYSIAGIPQLYPTSDRVYKQSSDRLLHSTIFDVHQSSVTRAIS